MITGRKHTTLDETHVHTHKFVLTCPCPTSLLGQLFECALKGLRQLLLREKGSEGARERGREGGKQGGQRIEGRKLTEISRSRRVTARCLSLPFPDSS